MSCQNCNSTCSCAIGAADGSVSVVGNGSGSSPYGVAVQRSSIADNALSVVSDGLYISSVSATISGGIIRCTSSTRPPAVDGRIIYESDTRNLLIYTDGSWRGVNASAALPRRLGSFSRTPYNTNEFANLSLLYSSASMSPAMPVAPYPLRAIYRLYGSIGGDITNYQVHYLNMYQGNTTATPMYPTASTQLRVDTDGWNYGTVAMMGYVDVATGESTDFSVWMYVLHNQTAGGGFVKFGFEITFDPI